MTWLVQPWWLVVLPLGMAPVLYILRRRTGLSGLLAALTALVAARLSLSMPFDWSFDILGRTLAVAPPDRAFLALSFLLVMLYFMYSSFFTQGRSYFYLTLVVMGFFSAVTMVESYVLGVLLLGMASTVLVLIVQAGRYRSVRGGLYYLSAVILAIPPLLVAAHLAETRVLNPIDEALPQSAAFMLVLGVSLLLGAFPFQAWLHAVSIEAPPLAVAFVLSVAHGLVFFKLFEEIDRFSWLLTNGSLPYLTLVLGLCCVAVGGGLAPFQHDFRRLLAWTVVLDTGIMLVAFASASSEGFAVLSLMILNRAIAVSLVGMGIAALDNARGGTAFQSLGGTLWQRPFAVLALAVGGLSLAGFPLTGGFTVRWLAIQSLPTGTQRWGIVLLIGGLVASIGFLRGIAATVGTAQDESHGRVGGAPETPVVARFLIVIFLVANLILTLYPQLVVDPVTRIMASWRISL